MNPSTGHVCQRAGTGHVQRCTRVTTGMRLSTHGLCNPSPLLSFQTRVEDFPLCDRLISNIDSPDSVIDRTQTY